MKNIKEKVEASLMLGSYLETVGFKNGTWEFNYHIKINTLNSYTNIWTTLLHHYLVLGGNMIDITNFNSSDDTIMIIATANAVIDGGGISNYIKEYLDNYDLLFDEKRASGITTLESLKQLKSGVKMPDKKENMGGNGAAMRTGPIGLMWYDDIEKVIEESIMASMVTHNYYLGFLGGMITALFTSFAMKNIEPIKWVEELLALYKNKTIHKYYPKNHKLEDLDEYMGYWKRYQETRISKLKYKNSLDNFIFPEDRVEYLLGFYPNSKIKSMVMKGQSLKKLEWSWDHIGSTGLDSCIYAYDCLLMSITSSDSNKTIDMNNITYNFDTFMTLVTIHPGDNDTTAAIGGTWYGAYMGYDGTNIRDKIKKLEFYEELLKVSNKINKLL
jgi:ADP-ribosylarginine hydrolase